jgi:hypothetical protein
MDKKKYDMVVIVIANENDFYNKFVNFYWKDFIEFSEYIYDIKIVLTYGQEYSNNLNESNVFINQIKDSAVPGCLIKTIKAMEYIEENFDYNYILRCNISCFFIISKLIETRKKMDKNNVYAGVIEKTNYSFEFISGACIWFSRDNINFILKNKELLDYNIPDDVSIGKLMKEKKKTKLNRLDIVSPENWISSSDRLEIKKTLSNDEIATLLNEAVNKNYFQLRIKIQNNRNIDIQIVSELTNLLYRRNKPKLNYNIISKKNKSKYILYFFFIIFLFSIKVRSRIN